MPVFIPFLLGYRLEMYKFVFNAYFYVIDFQS